MASLPRHAINRLAALHLVAGTMEAFANPVKSQLDETERGKAAVLASRITMAVERARKYDADGSGDRRLTNQVMRCLGAMDKTLPQEVDARIMLMAVIDLVARQEEAIPRTPKFLEKRIHWGMLHALLFEFYQIIDVDLTACCEIDKGCAVAERMVAA
jgi:hypothetical protein